MAPQAHSRRSQFEDEGAIYVRFYQALHERMTQVDILREALKKRNWTPMLEIKNPKESQPLLGGKSGMELNTK